MFLYFNTLYYMHFNVKLKRLSQIQSCSYYSVHFCHVSWIYQSGVTIALSPSNIENTDLFKLSSYVLVSI